MNTTWTPSTTISSNMHNVASIHLGEPEQLDSATWTRKLTITGLDGSELVLTLFSTAGAHYDLPEGYTAQGALMLPDELGQ